MKAQKSPEQLHEENLELKQLVKEFKVQVRKLQAKNTKLIAKNYAAALVSAKKKQNPTPKPEPMSKLEIARRVAFTDELKRRGLLKGKPFIDKKLS